MDPEFQKALQRNPHLGVYINEFRQKTGTNPEFVVSLSKDLEMENVNVILPVGDPVFIHLYGTVELGEALYYTIEPIMTPNEKRKYDAIMSGILEKSSKEPVPDGEAELKDLITKLVNQSVDVGAGGDIPDDGEKPGLVQKLIPKQKIIPLNQTEYNKILYFIERNIIGSGPIEPIIRDPYLEDIHSILGGLFTVYVDSNLGIFLLLAGTVSTMYIVIRDISHKYKVNEND